MGLVLRRLRRRGGLGVRHRADGDRLRFSARRRTKRQARTRAEFARRAGGSEAGAGQIPRVRSARGDPRDARVDPRGRERRHGDAPRRYPDTDIQISANASGAESRPCRLRADLSPRPRADPKLAVAPNTPVGLETACGTGGTGATVGCAARLECLARRQPPTQYRPVVEIKQTSDWSTSWRFNNPGNPPTRSSLATNNLCF